MTLSMKSKDQMTLGSALCLLVLAGCAHRLSAGPGSDHAEWGPASDGLQCSLARAEKGLPFTLRIRNVGARGVRLHFDRYEPPRAGSVINMPVRLDIRDRTGTPVLKLGEEPFGVLFTGMGILLKTDDVVPLDVGEQVQCTAGLQELYSGGGVLLEQLPPGTYSIRAVYDSSDIGSHAYEAQSMKDIWIGKLVSNVIQIDLPKKRK